jgi:hypothetical protein
MFKSNSSFLFVTLAALLTLGACAKKSTPSSTSESKTRANDRQGGGPGDQGGSPGGRGGRPDFSQLLTDMDANGDKQISASEAKGPLKERFSQMDTDKNGQLSEAEFKAAGPPKQGRQ